MHPIARSLTFAALVAVPTTALAAPERCNGRDDDLDGAIDEAPAACPQPVRNRFGKAYMFVRNSLPFWDAVDYCERYGYDLASIGTPQENRWLWEAAYNGSDNIGILNSWFWIGMTYEGFTYTWVNGEIPAYFVFGSNPPDPRGAYGTYVPWNPAPLNGQWALAPFQDSLKAVCESP